MAKQKTEIFNCNDSDIINAVQKIGKLGEHSLTTINAIAILEQHGYVLAKKVKGKIVSISDYSDYGY